MRAQLVAWEMILKRNLSVAESVSHKLYQNIYSFISRRISRQEDAEEIVQDVYLKLIRSEGQVREDKIQTWLYTTARNAIIDHYRKAGRQPTLSSIESLDSLSGEVKEEINQASKCLVPLLDELKQEDAKILIAVDMNDKAQKDYAKELNISYTALKSKVQRSRSKLKAKLLSCCKMTLNSKGLPVAVENGDDCC